MEITVKFTVTGTLLGESMPDPHAVAEGLLETFTNPDDPEDLVFRAKKSAGRYVELQITDADLVNVEA